MLSMFGIPKDKKVGVLLLTSMIFSLVLIPGIPIGWAKQLVPLFLLLSEITYLGIYIRQTRNTVIAKYFWIVIVAAIILIISSPHLHDISSIRAFIQKEILFKYFIGIYVFWLIRDERDTETLVKYSFWGIVILTIFGLINYITQSADIVVELAGSLDSTGIGVSGSDLATHFTDRDRSRVQSLFLFPHDYGYMCTVTLLFHLYAYTKNIETKSRFFITLACCLFGILLCGCRTVVICAIAGAVVFAFWGFNVGKTIRYYLIAAMTMLVMYMTVPYIQNQVNSILTVFDKTYYESESSTLSGRMMQLEATMSYVDGHEILGNGYHYFGIDLGWNEGDIVDKELLGLESIIFNYLLERGFLGLGLYILMLFVLLKFLFKNRDTNKELSAMAVSMIASYLVFAVMTGELNSYYPTILYVGFAIKLLYESKNSLALS